MLSMYVLFRTKHFLEPVWTKSHGNRPNPHFLKKVPHKARGSFKSKEECLKSGGENDDVQN